MKHNPVVKCASKQTTKSPVGDIANDAIAESKKDPRAAVYSKLTADLRGCLFAANSARFAERIWELFAPQEKLILNGSLKKAYTSFANLTEMWVKVRGGSLPRAAIEILFALEEIGPNKRRSMLQQLGEEGEDADATMELAIQSGCLVLADSPRRAYWETRQIKIDWDAKPMLWEYFLAVTQASKGGMEVDAYAFRRGSRTPINRKSRLLKTKGFPSTLAAQFGARGSPHKLSLLPARIRIFERIVHEDLAEWGVERTERK